MTDAFDRHAASYAASPRSSLILIVEDTDATARLIMYALAKRGYEVTHVRRLAHGKRLLEPPTDFGLAIIDQGLPDGNGWKLAEWMPHGGVVGAHVRQRLAA